MQREPLSSRGWLRARRNASLLAALWVVGVVLSASPAEAQRYATTWYPQRASSVMPVAEAEQPAVQDQVGVEAEGELAVEPFQGQGLIPRGSCPSCDDCASPCATCGPRCGYEYGLFGADGIVFPNGFWFRGEYLLWWSKAGNVPPLVTTSPAGTPQPQAGVLGQNGTTVLFGDDLSFGSSSGARFTLGAWLTPNGLSGLEATYFLLGRRAATFDETSTGNPILARPFLNVQTGQQDAVLIAFPSVSTGSVSVEASTELQSADLVLRRVMAQYPGTRFEFLAGYRYSRLSEDLAVNTSLSSGLLPPGTVVQVLDSFNTRNEFNGAEFGLSAQSRSCGWTLELLAKLAVGNTYSEVTINGSTTTTSPPAAPTTATGGLLALPSNMGRFERNDFTMIPELGVTLGYEVTPRIRATFGYTLFYWSKVARPGDQVDSNLNPSLLPPAALSGASQPQFRFITNDFWAQGLSLGFDCRF